MNYEQYIVSGWSVVCVMIGFFLGTGGFSGGAKEFSAEFRKLKFALDNAAKEEIRDAASSS